MLQSADALLRRALPVQFVEYTPILLERVGDDPEGLPRLLASVGYAHDAVHHGEGHLKQRSHPLNEPVEVDGYVDLVVRPPGPKR